jgi:hypothetical protein
MKYIIRCLIFSIVLISCGSKVPITESKDAIADDRIVGFWDSENPEENEEIHCIILKFNRKEYFIELQSINTNDLTVERDTLFCRAYISKVGDKRFLNVQPLDTTSIENREYFFYDYKFSGDSLLHVRELNDVDTLKINDFKTSDELYKFILDNVTNPALYGEEFILRKSNPNK